MEIMITPQEHSVVKARTDVPFCRCLVVRLVLETLGTVAIVTSSSGRKGVQTVVFEQRTE